MMLRMVEYGNGVGQVSGVGGGGGQPGGSGDVGAQAFELVTNTVDRIAALPPEMLVLLAVVILAGLVVLKRAF